MFASTDGKYRLLYVESAVDLTSYRECESWLKGDSRQSLICKSGPAKETWKGVVIHYTGRPVFVEEIATSMQHDMSHSVGITSRSSPCCSG
jgi:hypothetical protein